MQIADDELTFTESTIYSLIRIILTLEEKYKKGIIKLNFFQRAIKNAVSELFTLNVELKKRNLSFNEILQGMNVKEEYQHATAIIDKISINYPQENEKKGELNSNIFELPGLASQVTSSMITLMDALKIGGIRDGGLIFELFEELLTYLKKLPGFNVILKKISDIYNHVKKHASTLVSNHGYREKVADHLYTVFNEFQSNLTS